MVITSKKSYHLVVSPGVHPIIQLENMKKLPLICAAQDVVGTGFVEVSQFNNSPGRDFAYSFFISPVYLQVHV